MDNYISWNSPMFIPHNIRRIDMLQINNTSVKSYSTFVKVTNPETQETVEVLGMFDTGATISGITPKLIARLSLKGKGVYVTDTIDAPVQLSGYDFILKIKDVDKEFNINGCGTPCNYPMVDIIIGLDVIQQGDLRIKQGVLFFDLDLSVK